ncbi:hypothetical protein DMC01_05165 [Campylobacter troglodytis]|nr:hypothetical protein DMC01_05165 [Campylobacter troglodytis]
MPLALQEILDLEAKNAGLCQIRHQSLCKIFKEICILTLEECEKFSKMSGEIEEGESYFKTKGVCGKGGVVLTIKHLCFYFVKPLVVLGEGMLNARLAFIHRSSNTALPKSYYRL